MSVQVQKRAKFEILSFVKSGVVLSLTCIVFGHSPAHAASVGCTELNGNAGLYIRQGTEWRELSKKTTQVRRGANDFAFKPNFNTDRTLRIGVLVVKFSENYDIRTEGMRSRNYFEKSFPNTKVQMWRQGKVLNIQNCSVKVPTPFPVNVKLGEYIGYHRKESESFLLRDYHTRLTDYRNSRLECLNTDDTKTIRGNGTSTNLSNRDQFLFDAKAKKPSYAETLFRKKTFEVAVASNAPRLVVKSISYSMSDSATTKCPRFAMSINARDGNIQISDLGGRDNNALHYRQAYTWTLKK